MHSDIFSKSKPGNSMNVRVRFAPSPTGALHIGGIRTALYNFLFAKKNGGTFILRIEDTDQGRYVPGAEDYIVEALRWTNLLPVEGPGFGGPHAPYRQSERKHIYEEHARMLLENGNAYYAFDTPEELEAVRQSDQNFKYDSTTRMQMSNSLTLSQTEVDRRIDAGEPYVIRLKVPENESVIVHDLIRGEVTFQSNELDDKVMLKSDGMPTYHLANVVDDRLMEITHVIRGEEWLPSTGHHVLLYRAFGWEKQMPAFAHLPLILKPDGNGKLSKRDGSRLGIPVFPLSWVGATPEESFTGFREAGFLPEALVNFLAFFGWNPGTEQEIFSLEALSEAFTIERIGKGGSKFDIDKARWFNHQYIMAMDNASLARIVKPWIEAHGVQVTPVSLEKFVGLMKDRAVVLPDFWEKGAWFFREVDQYDTVQILKKWKTEKKSNFEQLIATFNSADPFTAQNLESINHTFLEQSGLKAGEVMPMLRIALTGSMQGPGVFDIIELLGKKVSIGRLQRGLDIFDQVIFQSQA